jgi:hypothetical protein
MLTAKSVLIAVQLINGLIVGHPVKTLMDSDVCLLEQSMISKINETNFHNGSATMWLTICVPYNKTLEDEDIRK